MFPYIFLTQPKSYRKYNLITPRVEIIDCTIYEISQLDIKAWKSCTLTGNIAATGDRLTKMF